MADLDDFFAKKDKKKSKTKKFTSSDELVKKLETGISKEKEPAKGVKKDEENEQVSPYKSCSLMKFQMKIMLLSQIEGFNSTHMSLITINRR